MDLSKCVLLTITKSSDPVPLSCGDFSQGSRTLESGSLRHGDSFCVRFLPTPSQGNDSSTLFWWELRPVVAAFCSTALRKAGAGRGFYWFSSEDSLQTSNKHERAYRGSGESPKSMVKGHTRS